MRRPAIWFNLNLYTIYIQSMCNLYTVPEAERCGGCVYLRVYLYVCLYVCICACVFVCVQYMHDKL